MSDSESALVVAAATIVGRVFGAGDCYLAVPGHDAAAIINRGAARHAQEPMPKTPKVGAFFRLSARTRAQINDLAALWGVSQAEAVAMAVDAVHRAAFPAPSVAAAIAAADLLTDGGRDDPA